MSGYGRSGPNVLQCNWNTEMRYLCPGVECITRYGTEWVIGAGRQSTLSVHYVSDLRDWEQGIGQFSNCLRQQTASSWHCKKPSAHSQHCSLQGIYGLATLCGELLNIQIMVRIEQGRLRARAPRATHWRSCGLMMCAVN